MIRFSKAICAALVAALLAGPVGAQDNPLMARIEAFVAAYNTGDAAAVVPFYTEDAVAFPPNLGHLVGRDSIAALYDGAFRNGVGQLQYQVLEIRGHGPDAAVEIASTQFMEGDTPITARSLHVWRLVDGAWFISRDIYNVVKVGE